MRRRLYDYVVERHDDVSRDEAAGAVGVNRNTAAFHLDRLVDEGLLEVTFRRLHGRSGPGAGRPSKLYRRSDAEYAVSVPPRGYDVMGSILVDAAEAAGAQTAVVDAAKAAGQRAGEDAVGDPIDALRALGYEPVEQEAGCVRLRNCPFHALAERQRDLVCGANVAFVQGLLDATGATGWSARLDPQPGECCVTLEGSKRKKS